MSRSSGCDHEARPPSHHARAVSERKGLAARVRAALTRVWTTLTLAVLASVGAVLVGGPAAYPDDIHQQQWYLEQLHADAATQLTDGAGVTVAVIDSGVDGHHPDLTGRVLAGIDLVTPTATTGPSPDTGPDTGPGNTGDGPAIGFSTTTEPGWHDLVGHGTAIASLIAGKGGDAGHIAGLAPGVKILPVRVLDARNRYHSPVTVALGIHWAVDHGAQVLNLSLGSTAETAEIASALRYAARHDAVVIACSGNRMKATVTASSGPATTGGHATSAMAPPAGSGAAMPVATTDPVWYPARADSVLAVSGLTRTGRTWTGSVTGAQVGISAPAADLIAARPGGHWRVTGTSFATALVSATAALVRAYRPELDAANVLNRLTATAHDLGVPGPDPIYGAGALDPLAALRAEVAPLPPPHPRLAPRADEIAPGYLSQVGQSGGSGSTSLWWPALAGLIAPLLTLAMFGLRALRRIAISGRAESGAGPSGPRRRRRCPPNEFVVHRSRRRRMPRPR